MTLRACPVCAKAAVADHRPFCSRRCADVDLQRWFAGAYAVPGAADDSPSSDDERARRDAPLDTSGRAR